MRTTFAILAGLLLSTSLAHAQPAGQVGPPPSFKIVASTDQDKGLIVFREIVYKQVPVVKEFTVIENGQPVKKLVTELVAVLEERRHEISLANGRVITPAGKRLPNDEVWKRVKANTVVVVSGDGNAPAQAYLRALNAETLVIIPGPPMPMKLPVPKS